MPRRSSHTFQTFDEVVAEALLNRPRVFDFSLIPKAARDTFLSEALKVIIVRGTYEIHDKIVNKVNSLTGRIPQQKVSETTLVESAKLMKALINRNRVRHQLSTSINQPGEWRMERDYFTHKEKALPVNEGTILSECMSSIMQDDLDTLLNNIIFELSEDFQRHKF